MRCMIALETLVAWFKISPTLFCALHNFVRTHCFDHKRTNECLHLKNKDFKSKLTLIFSPSKRRQFWSASRPILKSTNSTWITALTVGKSTIFKNVVSSVADRVFEVFVNSSASVYSCSEQFDAALISNYDFLGMEEVVSFTRPVVRNKMILLSPASQVVLFFSKAKNYHQNNKNQQEWLMV